MPGHRIERLVAKGLLQTDAGELTFLSPEYLEPRDQEVAEWRRFFQELGVDRRLVDERLKDSIAERVADTVLVSYERRHGRSPSRVPRAHERGYDFESSGRRIELKGRSRPEPPIDLTRTQYQALSDGDFYVYVVADALREPVLYVLRGPKLTGLLPEVSFSYREWSGLADGRFAVLEGEGDSENAASG